MQVVNPGASAPGFDFLLLDKMSKARFYKHYYMIDPDNKIELPGDPEAFVTEIKRCVKEVSNIGAIVSYKQGQELSFFSLSGLNRISPIQEKQLYEYIQQHPSE